MKTAFQLTALLALLLFFSCSRENAVVTVEEVIPVEPEIIEELGFSITVDGEPTGLFDEGIAIMDWHFGPDPGQEIWGTFVASAPVQDPNNPPELVFFFFNGTGEGVYELQFFHSLLFDFPIVVDIDNNLEVEILEYGEIGEFIIGEIRGSFMDLAGEEREVNGAFKVDRIQ